MIENNFTVGVVEAGITLVDEIVIDPSRTVTDVVRVRQETGGLTEDFKNAELLILEYGETLFKNEGNFQSLRKNILYKMIDFLDPSWKSILRQGIGFFQSYIVELPEGGNIIQLFNNAGLLTQSEDTSKWWKLISNKINLEDLDNLERLGLEGELLTIKYEKEILKNNGINKHPEHTANEDSSAGYDVLSWRKDNSGNIYEIQIESKMSSRTPPKFYLTRNEYETSVINPKTYCVYLWHIDNSFNDKPLKFDSSWLNENTPKDKKTGKWTEVLINPIESGNPDWQD